jgi:hypothetical protein
MHQLHFQHGTVGSVDASSVKSTPMDASSVKSTPVDASSVKRRRDDCTHNTMRVPHHTMTQQSASILAKAPIAHTRVQPRNFFPRIHSMTTEYPSSVIGIITLQTLSPSRPPLSARCATDHHASVSCRCRISRQCACVWIVDTTGTTPHSHCDWLCRAHRHVAHGTHLARSCSCLTFLPGFP